MSDRFAGDDRDLRPVFDPFELQLCDWVDGRLPPEERREFEAQLAADPRLAERARRYRATVERVRGGFEEVAPPAGLADAVLTQLRREQRPPGRARWPLFASLAAAAAVVAALVGTWQASRSDGPRGPDPEQQQIARFDRAETDDARAKDAPVGDGAVDELRRVLRDSAGTESRAEQPLLDQDMQQPSVGVELGERPAADPQLVQEGAKKAEKLGKAGAPLAEAEPESKPTLEPSPSIVVPPSEQAWNETGAGVPPLRRDAGARGADDFLVLSLVPDATRPGARDPDKDVFFGASVTQLSAQASSEEIVRVLRDQLSRQPADALRDEQADQRLYRAGEAPGASPTNPPAEPASPDQKRQLGFPQQPPAAPLALQTTARVVIEPVEPAAPAPQSQTATPRDAPQAPASGRAGGERKEAERTQPERTEPAREETAQADRAAREQVPQTRTGYATLPDRTFRVRGPVPEVEKFIREVVLRAPQLQQRVEVSRLRVEPQQQPQPQDEEARRRSGADAGGGATGATRLRQAPAPQAPDGAEIVEILVVLRGG